MSVILILETEYELTAIRAQGAGGQSVNKDSRFILVYRQHQSNYVQYHVHINEVKKWMQLLILPRGRSLLAI